MKIRVTESSSALPYARPGVVRDVNDVLARHLIALGHAEAIDPAETAVVSAPETAAARPRRKRGLGGDLFPRA